MRHTTTEASFEKMLRYHISVALNNHHRSTPTSRAVLTIHSQTTEPKTNEISRVYGGANNDPS